MTKQGTTPGSGGKPRRRLTTIRRTLALGSLATGALGGLALADTAHDTTLHVAPGDLGWIQLAQGGEGEGAASGGEGEGAASGEGEGGSAPDTEAGFLRDLGFMEGHLRAGLALYEAGDLEAAKTHMGHPIEEKYNRVADPLAERGFERLRAEITALAEAAEADAPVAEVDQRFATVQSTLDEIRLASSGGPGDRLLGLVLLTRVAGDEYTVAVDGGTVTNLHEYQDAWGFMRAVEAEAGHLTDSGDPAAAAAAETVLAQVAAVDAAFGDLQGGGDFTMDPSIFYGAAARMELAANGVD